MTKEIPQGEGQNELKVVAMPGQDEIVKKLQEAKLIGIAPQSDRFLLRFAESVADHEIVGQGLNMAWELAAYDTLQDQLPITRAAITMSFNQAVDAITPDVEVAAQAKAFRQQILDEMKQEAEKAKKPATEHASSNFELYVATRRIGDIVHEVARKVSTKQDRLWMQDWRNEGVNPYYNQSESGLFLDYSYGLPHSVWTPWGEWSFRGSASYSGGVERKLVEGVMEKLDTTLYRPETNNQMGTFGPTYAVHKVEGILLPEPVIRPRTAYLDYDPAKKAWETFTKQYKELKAKEPKK